MALKRLNLNLDEDLISKIDVYAEELHINRSACISVILSQFLSNKETVTTMGKMIDIYEKEKGNI